MIRPAAEADLEAVERIYAHHVLHGTGTFEEIPPSREEWIARRKAVEESGLPFLVAELDGKVAGYAYATQFRPRPAYRYTVEDSVYIDERMRSKGLGRKLLTALIEICEQRDRRQMIAVIGDRENLGSIALHRSLGFEHTGTLHAVGHKFGRWLDVVIMQRQLR